MTIDEALRILDVDLNTEPEEILERYDALMESTESSFYLQSKVFRAGECIRKEFAEALLENRRANLEAETGLDIVDLDLDQLQAEIELDVDFDILDQIGVAREESVLIDMDVDADLDLEVEDAGVDVILDDVPVDIEVDLDILDDLADLSLDDYDHDPDLWPDRENHEDDIREEKSEPNFEVSPDDSESAYAEEGQWDEDKNKNSSDMS